MLQKPAILTHFVGSLHIDGFEDVKFDRTLWNRLVMNKETKERVKNLAKQYNSGSGVVSGSKEGESEYGKITSVHKKSQAAKETGSWSADYLHGKGESLSFLLHGQPGVGKTYTAGMQPQR